MDGGNGKTSLPTLKLPILLRSYPRATQALLLVRAKVALVQQWQQIQRVRLLSTAFPRSQRTRRRRARGKAWVSSHRQRFLKRAILPRPAKDSCHDAVAKTLQQSMHTIDTMATYFPFEFLFTTFSYYIPNGYSRILLFNQNSQGP